MRMPAFVSSLSAPIAFALFVISLRMAFFCMADGFSPASLHLVLNAFRRWVFVGGVSGAVIIMMLAPIFFLVLG